MISQLLSCPAHSQAASAIVDSEHKMLGSMLQAVRDLCSSGADQCHSECCSEKRKCCAHAASDHLTDVIFFVIQHFAHEEKLMKQLPQNPDVVEHCDSHKVSHANIASEASKCAARIDDDNPAPSIERICELLSHWLEVHIREVDAELLEHFAMNGM